MSENAVVLKHLNNISMEAFRDFSSSHTFQQIHILPTVPISLSWTLCLLPFEELKHIFLCHFLTFLIDVFEVAL